MKIYQAMLMVTVLMLAGCVSTSVSKKTSLDENLNSTATHIREVKSQEVQKAAEAVSLTGRYLAGAPSDPYVDSASIANTIAAKDLSTAGYYVSTSTELKLQSMVDELKLDKVKAQAQLLAYQKQQDADRVTAESKLTSLQARYDKLIAQKDAEYAKAADKADKLQTWKDNLDGWFGLNGLIHYAKHLGYWVLGIVIVLILISVGLSFTPAGSVILPILGVALKVVLLPFEYVISHASNIFDWLLSGISTLKTTITELEGAFNTKVSAIQSKNSSTAPTDNAA